MKRLLCSLAVALLAVLGAPATAAAHPLGNFTVNQYSRLEPVGETLRVRYIVDMAEIPAFQERQLIDADGDGALSPSETERYLERAAAELAGGLHLTIDGAPAELRVTERAIAFLPGQGGLETLRLALELTAAFPGGPGPHAITYRVENYAERLGWREIVAPDTAGLRDSSAPSEDLSAELTAYPEELLSSPPDVREARLTVVAGGARNLARNESGAAIAEPRAAWGADQLAALVGTREPTALTTAAALLLALALGAGHALAPGHGKTIVAAYLVGSRGTARHAVVLGLVTTLTHTAGVFLLGFATLLLSRYVLPERIYPWLELVSGALVVLLGLGLLHSRLAGLLRRSADHAHVHGVPAHGHEHLHHGGPGGHTHDQDGAIADWVATGLSREGGTRARTTAPTRASWRGLLALGVSGGLLPCPSALVVLLGAIAIGRVGFGMLLILAFSLGLAAVLTGIGLLLVYARAVFDRVPVNRPLVRGLPVASALIVVVAGLAITTGALTRL
jgi:nickel/cobalt transporter (NicO) family protein